MIYYKEFIEDNFLILDKDTQQPVPFTFKPVQDKYYQILQEEYKTMEGLRELILKARQEGFSSIILALFTVDFIFVPYSISICIAHRKDITELLFKKVKFYLESYCTKNKLNIREYLKTDNKNFIESRVKNSIFYIGTAGSKVGGRGGSARNLHFSEAAWYQDTELITASEIVEGTSQQVPQGKGMIFIESCVSGDTLVNTSSGYHKIKDFFKDKKIGYTKINNLQLLGRYGYQPVSHLYYNGETKNLRIETQSGYSLIATKEHPLLSLDKNGIKKSQVGNLQIGNYVCIYGGESSFGNYDLQNNFHSESRKGTRYNINKFNPKQVSSQNLAYFLGLFLAEGYARLKKSGSYITLSSGDNEIHESLQKITGINWVRNDIFHSRCMKRSLVEFISFLGFSFEKAPYKIIPDIVLILSQENLKAFIQGMFDGDGCSEKTHGDISYVTTSKKIVETLQILLLKFGIYSAIRTHPPHTGGKIYERQIGQGRQPSYQLELSGRNSFLFYEKIGFKLQRKQQNKDKLPKNFNNESIPLISQGLLKEYIKEHEASYNSLHKRLSTARLYWGGGITQKKLKKILHVIGGENIMLNELAYAPYRWEKIKKINSITCETYDVTIPNGHTFVSNGILGFNTANGVDNFYQKEWERAHEFDKYGKRKSTYIPRFFGWQEFYTKEWVEQKKGDFATEAKWMQEYPGDPQQAFIASGTPFFDNLILEEMKKKAPKPIYQGRLAPDGMFL